jgi:hypothetical protein
MQNIKKPKKEKELNQLKRELKIKQIDNIEKSCNFLQDFLVFLYEKKGEG